MADSYDAIIQLSPMLKVIKQWSKTLYNLHTVCCCIMQINHISAELKQFIYPIKFTSIRVR